MDDCSEPKATQDIDYSRTLEVALELIRCGIPVFPAVLVGVHKQPLTSGLHWGASTDEGQIREWFTGARYLLCVPTGEISEYDVVDVDPRHGGDIWLAENERRMPTSVRYRTLQGGTHIQLRHRVGMRCSTSRIAPGIDVRGGGGFTVYWPGHGLPEEGEELADWPEWLVPLAMTRGSTAGVDPEREVPLSVRKPPSAQAVVDLLQRMPNDLGVGRDIYVRVMMAAKGCADALGEAGELDIEDDDSIAMAAAGWAQSWMGGGREQTDELTKWYEDWAHRKAPLAGWQTLVQIAGELIEGYREERAAEQFAAAPEVPEFEYRGNPHWPSMLRLNKNGGPQANLLMNVEIPLRYAPEWQGVLRWNGFAKVIELMAPIPGNREPGFVPRGLTDLDISATKVWLEQNYVVATVDMVLRGLKRAADDNSYHPVVDYLEGVRWDGVERLDTWLIRHLGAADTPLNRAYGAQFPISMVARVRDPGCKVDDVLIFEGRQGLGKSTALRVLADPWFTDHLPDLASKDAQMQLSGIWLVEFAEYGQLGRADANRAKNFISIQVDRLRAPYDRTVEDHPRQCVLAITLNPQAHGYLKDETGNRRFRAALCGIGWTLGRLVDVDALKRERDQLWAEADFRYRQGEAWHLTDPALIAAHRSSIAQRLELPPCYEKVAAALQRLVDEGVTKPSYTQITAAMGLSSNRDLNKEMQKQIGSAMTILGWTGSRERRDGDRATYYVKEDLATYEGERS